MNEMESIPNDDLKDVPLTTTIDDDLKDKVQKFMNNFRETLKQDETHKMNNLDEYLSSYTKDALFITMNDKHLKGVDEIKKYVQIMENFHFEETNWDYQYFIDENGVVSCSYKWRCTMTVKKRTPIHCLFKCCCISKHGTLEGKSKVKFQINNDIIKICKYEEIVDKDKLEGFASYSVRK